MFTRITIPAYLIDAVKSVTEEKKTEPQQLDEALKGQQHKIDKNKNKKIDAQDFAILRGEKKAVKEEEEQVEEGAVADTFKKIGKAAHKALTGGSDEDQLKRLRDNMYGKPGKTTVDVQKFKKNTAMDVQGLKKRLSKEEVEQIDELSKSTLGSYAKKATRDARLKHGMGKDFESLSKSLRKPEYKAGAKEWEDKYKSDARKREAGVNKAIDRLAKEEVEQLDETMTRKHFQQVADVIKAHPDQAKRNELAKHHAGIFKASNPRFDHARFYKAAGAELKEGVELEEGWDDMLKSVKDRNKPQPSGGSGVKQGTRYGGGKQKDTPEQDNDKVKKEEVELDERTLTSSETAKKERIVKSMKKGFSGFRARYGDRAKEVMYATATKQAKKD